ncbi:MAG: serine/threonine protein kinase, partial [Planctomycetes bacterium]|nr:serine/threonine protein kinase [Planctomycetota bacterium]
MLEDFEAFVRAGVERGVIDAEKGQALLRAWQERSAGPQEQARELVTGGFIDTSCLVELGDEIAFPYRQTLKVTLRECERPKEPARVLLPEGLPAEVEAVAAADRARHFVEREGKPPRFYLVQKAGQGGMGVVWKAWEVELRRWVAVKILTGKSEDDRKRFKREAQMAAGLQHANIVPVYEVGDWNGILFINMAYLPGRTLADARGTLKLEERVRCVMDAARAVQFAHEHGVLHRDLKPSNILLGERGAVYVCDFGLAKRMEPGTSLTMEGFVVGTPAYMPPEAATLAGPKGDPRSDVYSLGAVLYEMLTGRPPYKGADAMKVLLEVVSKEPKAPRKVDSRIPVELEVVCQKAMERHPWARYGSAGALADELGRWLRGEGIMARPTGRVVRLGRWVKARRVILGTAVGVAVVVAAGWMVRARVVA